MTREELLDKFRLLHQSGDPEQAHGTADDLLLEYINDKDITNSFNEIPKWYA